MEHKEPNIRTPRRFRIGAWRVHADLNRVSRGATHIRLEPRIMEVLCCLAARPGEVIPRRELLDTVWRDRVVVDQVLTRAIGQLRRVFEDDPGNARFIQTIPRRGYRLCATVVPEIDRPDIDQRRTTTFVRRGILAGLALVALATWIGSRAVIETAAGVDALTVMPFRHVPEHTYQAGAPDDLPEILNGALAEIPGLRLIAWDPSLTAREAPLGYRQIGNRLGVDAVVRGSVRKHAGLIRIDMQLVDTRNGEIIWTGTIGGDSNDMPDLQAHAAELLISGLRGTGTRTRNILADVKPLLVVEH